MKILIHDSTNRITLMKWRKTTTVISIIFFSYNYRVFKSFLKFLKRLLAFPLNLFSKEG